MSASSLLARDLADRVRRAFLQKLTDAGVRLTPWETQFVADLLAYPRPLTDLQRQAIDGLIKQYTSCL